MHQKTPLYNNNIMINLVYKHQNSQKYEHQNKNTSKIVVVSKL